jgi:hypothetical protein
MRKDNGPSGAATHFRFIGAAVGRFIREEDEEKLSNSSLLHI